ncbi:MAG: branched-chain amino acid ABC transporter permease [Bacillota bacterium]|nr:branched-chain amino acid ABC transporter permease [Bacillota bacterium]
MHTIQPEWQIMRDRLRLGWRGYAAAGVYAALVILVMLAARYQWSIGSVELANPYYLHNLTLIGINVILVASLNLVNGYLGEFAIGHAGFLAVGAYASSVVTLLFHQSFWVALPVGALAGAVVGYLIALPAFKTFGDYLAIVTLGFNMIIVNIIQNLEVIGGPRGWGGQPKMTSFWLVAVVAGLSLIILRNLVYSNYGRVWLAIRENEIAAEMMGVDVMRYKMIAFVIAAFFAGLAGALWAHYQQYIHPSSFTYLRTTDLLVMLYLGGMASLSGSVLGVTIMTVLLESLRGVLSQFNLAEWRMVISPLVLIVIMLTRPQGLMGNREFAFVPRREEVPRREPARG